MIKYSGENMSSIVAAVQCVHNLADIMSMEREKMLEEGVMEEFIQRVNLWMVEYKTLSLISGDAIKHFRRMETNRTKMAAKFEKDHLLSMKTKLERLQKDFPLLKNNKSESGGNDDDDEEEGASCMVKMRKPVTLRTFRKMWTRKGRIMPNMHSSMCGLVSYNVRSTLHLPRTGVNGWNGLVSVTSACCHTSLVSKKRGKFQSLLCRSSNVRSSSVVGFSFEGKYSVWNGPNLLSKSPVMSGLLRQRVIRSSRGFSRVGLVAGSLFLALLLLRDSNSSSRQ